MDDSTPVTGLKIPDPITVNKRSISAPSNAMPPISTPGSRSPTRNQYGIVRSNSHVDKSESGNEDAPSEAHVEETKADSDLESQSADRFETSIETAESFTAEEHLASSKSLISKSPINLKAASPVTSKKAKKLSLLKSKSSLKDIATKVRKEAKLSKSILSASSSEFLNQSNVSQSDVSDLDEGSSELTQEDLNRPTMHTMADVAKQVVNTKRAAKGFKAMWATKETEHNEYLIHGIHLEKKKLDLRNVAAEYKEMKRSQFYQELLVYVVFLFLFFTLFNWLPILDSFQQSDVIGDITCNVPDACTQCRKMDELYDFAKHIQTRICSNPSSLDYVASIDNKKNRNNPISLWNRIGGVSLRQVRVKSQNCNLFHDWNHTCYPEFQINYEMKEPLWINTAQSDESGGEQSAEAKETKGTAESTNAEVSKQDDKMRFDWHPNLFPLLASGEFVSKNMLMFAQYHKKNYYYGTGGYTVDLCAINSNSIDQLQQQEWLDLSTRAVSIDFVLLNPATRMFTISLHVFAISASGHMTHASQSVNIRILGLESPPFEDDSSFPNRYHDINYIGSQYIDKRIFLWLIVLIFVFIYIRGEINEMNKIGLTSYMTIDTWNIFELAHLYLLVCALYYILMYYVQCSNIVYTLSQVAQFSQSDAEYPYVAPTEDQQQLNHHVNGELFLPLLHTFQSVSDYASLSAAISLLKIFKFLRMNSTLNLLWQVLGMAIKDLMGFLIIFNLIFLSYSAMGNFAFGFALEEFSTLMKSYATCFHMLAGDFDYARLQQANPRIAPIFFVTFVILVFQILVNMFVAILSEYYEVAKDASNNTEDVEYDVITRFKEFVSSCSPVVDLKDSEILYLKSGQTIRLISTNLVDKEVTRQHAKKLFRGAVWRVLALLRFGMKFDRKIGFEKRSNTNNNTGGSGNANGLKVTHIPLSENFDHRSIKKLLPKGIFIRLVGDSLLGTDILLRVIRHSSLSIECLVLGLADNVDKYSTSAGYSEKADEEEDILELVGGETLRIPWRLFAIHVLKTILHEFKLMIMRAMKWWDPMDSQLIDDFHLYQLLKDERENGKTSLRFDELNRILDLYLRKDRRFHRNSDITSQNIRRETSLVMYRFRNSLIDMPSREKEGHDYVPKPINTSNVELNSTLLLLSDKLAENCHDMWAIERLKQGWLYGKERNDAMKLHPNLVPYKNLTKEEQEFDLRTSIETLKTIVSMNFNITRQAARNSRSLLHSSSNISNTSSYSNSGGASPKQGSGDNWTNAVHKLRNNMFESLPSIEDNGLCTTFSDDMTYTPRPVDTSQVELPNPLLRLVDLLAENAHEVWSKGRMDDGWTYGPQRDDKSKKHPCLVPFVFLTEEEKEYDVTTAMGTLRLLYALGFHIIDPNGVQV